MTTSSEVMKLIKDKEVQFVDLRFNDLRGKMQHVTFDVDMFEESYFQEGTMFDGSSISGWKAINESDMVMRPDPNGAHIDPFFQQTTLALFCDILEPGTLQPYSRDPRSIAKKAEAYVKQGGFGDTCYFGQKPSSSCSMTSAGPLSRTTPATASIPPNSRTTPAKPTKPAIWVTAQARRAATSPSRRSTLCKTCAARCFQ